MRWCWQQDFRNRPSALQLSEILTNPSIPRLVDALNLHNSNEITCATICTLPIEVLPPPTPMDIDGSGILPPASPHLHVTRGDLQEELWLSTFTSSNAEIVVINFKDKVAQVCITTSSTLLKSVAWYLHILRAVQLHVLSECTHVYCACNIRLQTHFIFSFSLSLPPSISFSLP